MKTRYQAIYKYKVRNGGVYTMMPAGAKPLSIGQQGGDIMCWAIVDPDAAPLAKRKILAIPTGKAFGNHDGYPGQFIGTVQMDNGLVFHFFDLGEELPESEGE